MIESDVSYAAVRKTGRAFLLGGGLVAMLLLLGHSHVSGLWDWNWRLGLETQGWRWFLGSGLALFAASRFAYPLMKPVHVGWMTFAHTWGWVSTRILLFTFFFVVLTPMGWLMRLLGKDLLEEKTSADASTYWKQRSKSFHPRNMERQF